PHSLAQPRSTPLEKPQLAGGIETAMPDPLSEIKIQPRNPVRVVLGFPRKQSPDLALQLRCQHLVGVEQQNPFAGTKIQGNILLLSVPVKYVIAGLRAERLRNL